MEHMQPRDLFTILGSAVAVVVVGTLFTAYRHDLARLLSLLVGRYVVLSPAAGGAKSPTVSAHRKAEEEDLAEEEEAEEEAEEPPPAPGISAAELNRLLEQTREEAAARALGTLLGAGLVVEGGRSRAMVALFGPAGRRHTRLRPFVEEAAGAAQAAAEPTPEAEPARLLKVTQDGQERLIPM